MYAIVAGARTNKHLMSMLVLVLAVLPFILQGCNGNYPFGYPNSGAYGSTYNTGGSSNQALNSNRGKATYVPVEVNPNDANDPGARMIRYLSSQGLISTDPAYVTSVSKDGSSSTKAVSSNDLTRMYPDAFNSDSRKFSSPSEDFAVLSKQGPLQTPNGYTGGYAATNFPSSTWSGYSGYPTQQKHFNLDDGYTSPSDSTGGFSGTGNRYSSKPSSLTSPSFTDNLSYSSSPRISSSLPSPQYSAGWHSSPGMMPSSSLPPPHNYGSRPAYSTTSAGSQNLDDATDKLAGIVVKALDNNLRSGYQFNPKVIQNTVRQSLQPETSAVKAVKRADRTLIEAILVLRKKFMDKLTTLLSQMGLAYQYLHENVRKITLIAEEEVRTKLVLTRL